MEVICNLECHPMGCHGGCQFAPLAARVTQTKRWGRTAVKSNPRYCLGSGTAACTAPVLAGSGTGGCRRSVCCFQTSFVPSLKAGAFT